MKRFLIVWAVVFGIFLYFLGETAGKVSFSTLLLSLPGTAVFALIITKLLKPRPEEKELEKQWILKKENIEKNKVVTNKKNTNDEDLEWVEDALHPGRYFTTSLIESFHLFPHDNEE